MQNETIPQFLIRMKKIAEAKAVQMANLELANWSEKTEKDLMINFGYTKQMLADRKADLMSKVY